MKVIYNNIVKELDDIIANAKLLEKGINYIILTENEAYEYFMLYESLLKMGGDFEGFLDFKNLLIDKGFYHGQVKLKMEKV